jgi:polyketide cyclase/dehydrase/lipid transport protein
MEKQRMQRPGTNALKREFVARAEVATQAPPEVVYDVLADVGTHLRWAGEMQHEKNRMRSIDAPEGAATVGTEFTSTGTAPEGAYTDRSVVTEATRPSVFEFVTQAHLETKKGTVADLTNVIRYEIRATQDGCRISGTLRLTRASALPGPLAFMNVGVLSPLVRRESEKLVRRGLQNLAAVAQERAAAGRA